MIVDLPLRLWTDRRGAAAIEFGLTCAMFISILLACLQIALSFFAAQGLQTASEAIARKVLTGQIAAGTTSQSAFKTEACRMLPPYMSCAKLLVDVRTVSTFSDATYTAPQLTYDSNGNVTNTFSYDTGGADDIVVLRLMYPWSTPRGPLGFSLADQQGSQRLLTGTMVFKSEPRA